MTRKERKEKRLVREAEVLQEVADVAAEYVKSGGTTQDAILEADKWLLQQIKQTPQEAELYRKVAAEYSRRLSNMIEERKDEGDNSGAS